MTSWRRRQGYAVNRKRVRRLMRRMGLPSVAPKPCTSQPAPGHPVYPYLRRGLAIVRPNQVWCTDITYIRLAHGFVYLTAVMDWYSRYVLSWEVSVTLAEEFCISALQSAWRGHGRPEIVNSEQGRPVHQPGLDRGAQRHRGVDQQGWQGTGDGQYHGRSGS